MNENFDDGKWQKGTTPFSNDKDMGKNTLVTPWSMDAQNFTLAEIPDKNIPEGAKRWRCRCLPEWRKSFIPVIAGPLPTNIFILTDAVKKQIEER